MTLGKGGWRGNLTYREADAAISEGTSWHNVTSSPWGLNPNATQPVVWMCSSTSSAHAPHGPSRARTCWKDPGKWGNTSVEMQTSQNKSMGGTRGRAFSWFLRTSPSSLQCLNLSDTLGSYEKPSLYGSARGWACCQEGGLEPDCSIYSIWNVGKINTLHNMPWHLAWVKLYWAISYTSLNILTAVLY